MEDVISLSSGSEVDSDVEVVGVYSDNENKAESKPFIRGGWVNLAAYTPCVIDIRSIGQKWTIPQPRKQRRKHPEEPVEVLDLSDNLSDHSGPVLGSPECQWKKKRVGITKHKGPRTRSPDSLSRSPPEQELYENKAVLKAEESENLEQPDDKCAMKSSDIGIPKSPSIPKSDLPAQNADVLELSLEQITQESQQYSGMTSQPLCEGKDSQCLMSEAKNFVNFPNEDQTSCTRKEERDALKVEEHVFLFTMNKPVRIETKEEPGSSQSLLDTDLSPSPQNLVDKPCNFPGDLNPEHIRFSDGFSVFKTQHNNSCYSPIQIPFETSLCPSPPEDETLRVNLSDPFYDTASATSIHSFKQDTVFPNTPSASVRPFCPSIEPDQHAPQESSHDHPNPPQLTTSTTSLGPSPEESNSKNVSLPNRTPSPTSTVLLAGESPDWTMDENEVELAMCSPLMPYNCSIPSDPPLSLRSEEMDEEARPRTTEADLGTERLMTTAWKNGSDEEEMGGEKGGGEDDAVVSREDKHYVCPVQLKKLRPLMSGPVKDLENEEEEDDGLGDPEPLCRQSLSLVYSTMEESYPEGTLQLLSDLLQPRFFPPIDITRHLLRGILLEPQCPDVLCLEAYSLLMRTQMHNHTDKTTVPWDWELLTTVMAAEQNQGERFRSDVVRMLLQYVVQTLEDDFRVKLSFRDLRHSIANATLSCNLHFNQVRDVINWLFAAIVKSVGHNNNMSADIIRLKTQKEHLKMAFFLQKMLSLALEVDLLPALNSSKLSGELFHMIISTFHLRHHRLLLLETLESRLLRCKLTEHLLRDASPQKTPMLMSPNLLLHFLHNASLTPDPTDGAESWKKWEELVQLLWMLLLSYEEVVKCHLRIAVTERRGYSRILIQTKSECVLRLDVQEAVEAFLYRSETDLGQALPPHVHESLTYLQDHLLASAH